jgi:hypothetical protein
MGFFIGIIGFLNLLFLIPHPSKVGLHVQEVDEEEIRAKQTLSLIEGRGDNDDVNKTI